MRILLASDQMHVCSMLKQLVRYDSELRIVGEVVEAGDLLSHAQEARTDWVLLDWGLPGLQATDLPKLRRFCGVVAFGKKDARQEAVAARANAFVNDEEPLKRLLDILRTTGGLSPTFAG